MRHAITISMPEELARELNATAKRHGQTRSQYVCQVLNLWGS
jgi:metal-responsive CopG/Arc/MetJ family transcriptional regulator